MNWDNPFEEKDILRIKYYEIMPCKDAYLVSCNGDYGFHLLLEEISRMDKPLKVKIIAGPNRWKIFFAGYTHRFRYIMGDSDADDSMNDAIKFLTHIFPDSHEVQCDIEQEDLDKYPSLRNVYHID